MDGISNGADGDCIEVYSVDQVLEALEVNAGEDFNADCIVAWAATRWVKEVSNTRSTPVDRVPCTWAGLLTILDRLYPLEAFTGEHLAQGPIIVALLREIERQRQGR